MNPFAYFIPPRARTVVEFGCGKGELGGSFLQIQPQCRYIGVDKDKTLLGDAGKHLKETLLGTVETADIAGIGAAPIDCILYGKDYINPEKITEQLKAHLELLAPDGQFLFLVDNPGYFHNAVELLRGQPPLFPGAMALAELIGSIESAGVKVERVQPVYSEKDRSLRESEATKEVVSAFARFCSSNGLGARNDIWARGYAVRAVREPLPPRTMLQVFQGEGIVTARIRLDEPNRFCNTVPGFYSRTEEVSAPAFTDEQYPKRIMIRQRMTVNSVTEGLSIVRKIADSGYLLIHEMDDSPSRWKEDYEKTEYVDFAGSHAIQVSTPVLAEEMRRYNPLVKVFMNHMEYLPEAREYPSDEEAPITIFFGALNREDEWGEIMPVLNEVSKVYGKKIRFRVLSDKNFFEKLKSPNKEFVGQEHFFNGKYVPYHVYVETLRTADIALLPLHENTFNRAKSDLKFIESAAHGAVALASPTVYRDTMEDGKTGLIYRNAREFREKLMLLVENRERRLDIARNAYEYVKHNRLLSQHYEERIAWYDELTARLPELNKALEKRLAKIEKKVGKKPEPAPERPKEYWKT